MTKYSHFALIWFWCLERIAMFMCGYFVTLYLVDEWKCIILTWLARVIALINTHIVVINVTVCTLWCCLFVGFLFLLHSARFVCLRHHFAYDLSIEIALIKWSLYPKSLHWFPNGQFFFSLSFSLFKCIKSHSYISQINILIKREHSYASTFHSNNIMNQLQNVIRFTFFLSCGLEF